MSLEDVVSTVDQVNDKLGDSAKIVANKSEKNKEKADNAAEGGPIKRSKRKYDDPDKKRKQPPFLERNVEVDRQDEINHNALLKSMHKRFQAGYKRWMNRSKSFKLANLFVTLLVISIQVAQVIIFQLPEISESDRKAIATILPAVTGAILSVQLKLAWAEKGTKSKKAARLYRTLASHIEYRIDIAEAGGELIDSVKIWNTALLSESREVPAFLSIY
ncbi:uncharacterized protein LOC143446028 isoform X2 [Clavelina lepadiformis]|uniref:SMODS and SLOG-associating 2TM effector domain-containing protein n=1 Tax=Clavelina lepadiformis TaxID=159417 RepID=A0ABP0GUH6_CLALP